MKKHFPLELQRKNELKSGYVITKKQISNFGYHYHDFYEVEFFVSGEAIVTINGNVTEYSRGGIYLLRPLDLHEFKVKSGGIMYSINFLPEVLSDDVFRSFLSGGRFLSATFSEKDSALTELLLEKLLLLQNAGNDEKTSSAILTLIVTMLLGVDSEKQLLINDGDIYKAIIYVSNNFTSSPSLTEACAVAGLTKTYFCRKFKSVTGKSYVAFLSELKIDFACNLIKGGKMNFTEVCYASGFNSVSQFIREFKKIKGVTPSLLKQKALEKLQTC